MDSRRQEIQVKLKGKRRGKKKTVKTLQCLVSWLDYDGAATWEPEENLKNAQAKVHKFHRRHPNAPRPDGYTPPSVIEDDES